MIWKGLEGCDCSLRLCTVQMFTQEDLGTPGKFGATVTGNRAMVHTACFANKNIELHNSF